MRYTIILLAIISIVSCKGKITPCFDKEELKKFESTKDFICKGKWEKTDYEDIYVNEYPIIKSCNFTDNGLAKFQIKTEDKRNQTISLCYRLNSDSTIEFTDKKGNISINHLEKVNENLVTIVNGKQLFCMDCVYPAVPHYTMILKRK